MIAPDVMSPWRSRPKLPMIPWRARVVRSCFETDIRLPSERAGAACPRPAAAYSRAHGITVINGGCPCMFGPTADLGHKTMRFVFTPDRQRPQKRLNQARRKPATGLGRGALIGPPVENVFDFADAKPVTL